MFYTYMFYSKLYVLIVCSIPGALLVVCVIVKMQNIPMCRCGSDDRCFQRTDSCHRTENWCYWTDSLQPTL